MSPGAQGGEGGDEGTAWGWNAGTEGLPEEQQWQKDKYCSKGGSMGHEACVRHVQQPAHQTLQGVHRFRV